MTDQPSAAREALQHLMDQAGALVQDGSGAWVCQQCVRIVDPPLTDHQAWCPHAILRRVIDAAEEVVRYHIACGTHWQGCVATHPICALAAALRGEET